MAVRRLLLVFMLFASASPAWGDVLAALTFERKVVRLDEITGEVVPGWQIDLSSRIPPFSKLSGIATDGSGVVYISSIDTKEVFEYDLQTGAAIGDGIFAQLPGSGGPGAIKIGPDDFLYVAENNGSNIYRYNRTTADQTAIASNLMGVGGLAFNNSGALLSTDFTFVSPSQIYLGTGAPPLVLFPASPTSPLYAPNGILVRADGSFLVADLVTNGIYQFSSTGMFQGLFSNAPVEFPTGIDPNNPGTHPPGTTAVSNFPSDMVTLPDGSVLLVTLGISSQLQGASQNYGSLIRYSAAGAQLERVEDGLFPIGAITLAAGLTPLPGDYNRDGAVTQADYAVFTDSFGRLVTLGSNADGNRNGAIDAADYVVWRDALPTPGLAAGGVVPEPGALVVAMASLILFAFRGFSHLS